MLVQHARWLMPLKSGLGHERRPFKWRLLDDFRYAPGRSYAGATDAESATVLGTKPTTSIGDTDGSPSSEQPRARRSP
jgi:hypothetical protein